MSLCSAIKCLSISCVCGGGRVVVPLWRKFETVLSGPNCPAPIPNISNKSNSPSFSVSITGNDDY